MAVLREELSASLQLGGDASVTSVALKLTEFDQRHYVKLIRARGETIRRVVTELRQALGLVSAASNASGPLQYAA